MADTIARTEKQGTENLEALLALVKQARADIVAGMAARALTRYDRERMDYVTDMLRDLIEATEEAIDEVLWYGDRA